jgi:hypothetical protein
MSPIRVSEWRYGSIYSQSRQHMDVSVQLHAPVALPPRKDLLCTRYIGGWVGRRVGHDGVKKTHTLPLP